VSFGALSDKAADVATNAKLADMASAANAKVTDALTSLKSGFTAKDVVNILNLSIINFPTAGYEVPASEMALLQKAAAQIKRLASGTVLEIAGYTDNTGDAAANQVLSQQRADAVRNGLIDAGVDPSLLVAKGYGSANPVGSNESNEGRLHNRRIEYHVIKS
jgi:OmpA-OmpF porin, OOP family